MDEHFEVLKVQMNGLLPKEMGGGEQTGVPGVKPPTTSARKSEIAK